MEAWGRNLAGGGGGIAREYRINERIRAREVRVIDENGEQLGILSLSAALQHAREKELDLVEVASNSDPPVCRLLDYGRFRYLQTKRQREERKGQRNVVLREVRFRPRIGEHDLQAKIRVAQRLLGQGDKVKVSVRFRGRENTHPELGMGLLKRVADQLKEEAKLERAPTMEGNMLGIILAPTVVRMPPKDDGELEDSQDVLDQDLDSAEAEDT